MVAGPGHGLAVLFGAGDHGQTTPGRTAGSSFRSKLGTTSSSSLSPDGSGLLQLTHYGSSDAVWPAWAPDGAKIAFERDYPNHASIVTINPDEWPSGADSARMR